MTGELDEKIRIRAYEIWEREGYCGDPRAHWLEAERQLLETTDGPDVACACELLREDWAAVADLAAERLMRGVRARYRRRR